MSSKVLRGVIGLVVVGGAVSGLVGRVVVVGVAVRRGGTGQERVHPLPGLLRGLLGVPLRGPVDLQRRRDGVPPAGPAAGQRGQLTGVVLGVVVVAVVAVPGGLLAHGDERRQRVRVGGETGGQL